LDGVLVWVVDGRWCAHHQMPDQTGMWQIFQEFTF
jgi:hypothetical protein